MQDIDVLGAEIEDAWAAANHRAEDFAAIATAALEKRSLATTMSIDGLVRWFGLAPHVPHQPAGAQFGEPPIKVYEGRRFYIEVLFWTDGTTAIHQHGFSGAFQVLAGGSIHTTYEFAAEEAINRELVLGKLAVTGSELLRRGDIRPIRSGDQFIHSLFHLDRPSVTLVARTDRDSGSDPQYSYYHPGIAFAPFVADERASRLLRLLAILDPQAATTPPLLVDLIGQVDLLSAVNLSIHWFRMHPVDTAMSEPLLAAVARRHRRLASKLALAVEEGRRQALVINRRRRHHRAEHRFFLALLLNVGDRAQILRFVEQQYPGKDPIELILGWIEELLGRPGERTAPEYELGEPELLVLRHLLQQRTPEQVIAALDAEYDDVEEQRGRILELCASLTDSALFRPLFRASP